MNIWVIVTVFWSPKILNLTMFDSIIFNPTDEERAWMVDAGVS